MGRLGCSLGGLTIGASMRSQLFTASISPNGTPDLRHTPWARIHPQKQDSTSAPGVLAQVLLVGFPSVVERVVDPGHMRAEVDRLG